MKQLKVGLTGLGRIGKAHLNNLVYRIPEVQVVAVSDVDPGTENLAQEYGIPAFYRDFENVLQHKEIEAVVICSPTPTHLNFIEMAAHAGKHVFCEKPLEMTLDKIEMIEQIVDEANIRLQVGFNRRFDSDFARIKNGVLNGEIGEPHILKITSRDPAPPPVSYVKISGGLFLDMTIHDFDMARFMVGSEVTEVYAQGAVRVDAEIGAVGDIDTAVVQLKFANGVFGVIDNSRKSVYGYDQRLEIFGSSGMLLNENHHLTSAKLFSDNGSSREPALHFFMERYASSYLEEMRAFVRSINEGSEISVSSYDAKKATQIAVAALKSLHEKRPVQIKEIE